MQVMKLSCRALLAMLPLTAMPVACTSASKLPILDPEVTAAEPWPAALHTMLPAILADAARRSGAAVERLRAASVQAVTWPDGSLGCPQPGRLYTQALVPGWRIVIAVPTAAALHYHAGQRAGWVWCPAERATPALPAAPDSQI